MANIRDEDREKARVIVKRCGLRDGLFKGPRTLNAVETIAYDRAELRADLHRQVTKAVEAVRDHGGYIIADDALSAIDRVFEDGNKKSGEG